jgi:hypothetical protein
MFNADLAYAAYLGSGLLQKVIDIPAADRTREWRDWQADDDAIKLIRCIRQAEYFIKQVDRWVENATVGPGASFSIECQFFAGSVSAAWGQVEYVDDRVFLGWSAALDIEPRLAAKGLDEEVLLAGTALPTLLSYARLMKAMGGGGVDVLALFRVHGMSIEAWTSTATAWGALLSSRPAVAMRFGELLMATWVPRGRER